MMGQYDKRKFTIFEHIPIVARASLGFLTLRFLKRKKVMDFQFKERIMLAVTEVNGCVLCSYIHTKLAKQSGMTDQAIRALLSGELSDVPQNQMLAVLFAQDYAFHKETIDQEFYLKLSEVYGVYGAKAILSACEVITMTNAMGIALGLLIETLKFRHIKGSPIIHEVLIPLSTLLLFPFFVILGLLIIPFRFRQLKKNAQRA